MENGTPKSAVDNAGVKVFTLTHEPAPVTHQNQRAVDADTVYWLQCLPVMSVPLSSSESSSLTSVLTSSFISGTKKSVWRDSGAM